MTTPCEKKEMLKPNQDVTVEALVRQWIGGKRESFNCLLERTYRSHFLNRAKQLLLHEQQVSNHLPAAALVHRTYEKMIDHPPSDFEDMPFFWRLVERNMKHIIIDAARKAKREKRGGQHRCENQVPFTTVENVLNGKGARGSL